MELMHQTLEKFLFKNRGTLPMEKQVDICYQISCGLTFLHRYDPQILHCDVASKNILLNEDGSIVKISDLGQAQFRPSNIQYLSTKAPGCVIYMPPECLGDRPQFTAKSDTFSFGVVMLHVLTQEPPSCGLKNILCKPEIERRADDLSKLSYDHPLKSLIVACLDDNPTKRPDMSEVQSTLGSNVAVQKQTSELSKEGKVSRDVGNVCEVEDLGALAHEAELEKLCWIPFGIQTLTVGEEGGLFPLQPQTTEVYEDNDVIALEVPEGAVNTDVCDRLCIRYGVIVFGPFDLPEGYQLGSMAVYIYFNQDHAVKPVVVHLPHWSGKDGESGLKCVVAPHRLEEGEEKYKFKDVYEGDVQSREGRGLITIDSHCSLFADALKEETSLKYYATGHERYDKKGTRLDVVITYASPVWLEILQKYRCPVSHPVLFEFAGTHIKGSVSPAGGPGWTSWRDKNFVVMREDVEFKSHGITSPEHLEMAVERKAYPPFISCRTDYRKELRDEGQPTRAILLIEGARDKPMEFLCSAYSYTLQERDVPIRRNTSPQRQVSKTSTHTTVSTEPPSSLRDSDKDFDTPPSTPPEKQVPVGRSTGSPTSDGQGVPSSMGILGVVETILNWEMLAVRLGVPLAHIDECKNDTTLGKSKTFNYWRNGRCDRNFPITWAFLLECVEKNCGTRVSEELKKRASKNPTWTEK